MWEDTRTRGFGDERFYVVQTVAKVIQRCILMATDPGDLVLDPTCGSGTTAYVAEQWGRRWITIDTSRVALALARTRLMAARYPWYLLADSQEGRRKEAELTGKPPFDGPTRNDLRQGFVYERVPHITLKSIANNSRIDDIWEKWRAVLEPLRAALNAALGRGASFETRSTSAPQDEGSIVSPHPLPRHSRASGNPEQPRRRSLLGPRFREGDEEKERGNDGGEWQEWEIPREADADWAAAALERA